MCFGLRVVLALSCILNIISLVLYGSIIIIQVKVYVRERILSESFLRIG